MKYAILILMLLICSLTDVAQNKSDIIIQKIKDFVKRNSAAPDDKKVFVNKADVIIELGRCQIPLTETKTSYRFNDYTFDYAKHFVKFTCNYNEECIIGIDGRKDITGIQVPFKTKENCYDFINLIDELKRNLR